MSRTPIATVAGIVFILAYMAAVTVGYDALEPMHWALVALYFLVAGVLWVLPVRFLMLWAAHKR